MRDVVGGEVWLFLVESLDARIRGAGLDPGALTERADLLDAGVLDSLGIIETLAVVEDHFGLETDWDDYDPEDLFVMGPFCRYVEREIANRPQIGADPTATA